MHPSLIIWQIAVSVKKVIDEITNGVICFHDILFYFISMNRETEADIKAVAASKLGINEPI